MSVNTHPRVTVITPFLNAERFLEEAVDSVLAQEYEHWELLLVDDGSKDGGTRIARRYAAAHPDRIRYLAHPGRENRGMCASRNLALEEATGDLIAPLDADDEWLPEKLRRQVAILREHPDAGMVFGRALYWNSWDPDSPADGDFVPEAPGPPDRMTSPPELLLACHPLGTGTAACPSDLMVRRAVLEQVGGFEEGFSGFREFFEDQALLAKIYLSTRVFVSGETWIRYRLHSESCSAQTERAGKGEEARAFYLEWLGDYLAASSTRAPDVEAARKAALRPSRSPGSGSRTGLLGRVVNWIRAP